jgi:transposase
MEVVHDKCAGLDVHKKTVVACVLSPGHQEVRTFGTMTRELIGMADWLRSFGVTHVAMESTGVYWRAIFNLLEGNDFDLLVANPRYMRAVPDRKTDVKDAEWIADLLRHGLLRASFVPDRGQRELRELVRYRKVVEQERARMVVRIEKVLEGANIKLTSVASHVLSMSSRAMLDELIAGNQDAEAMAELARSNMRSKRAQLKEALVGNVGEHQQFMLASHLRLIDQLDAEIESLSSKIEERMRPFQAQIDLIDEIPGIGRRGAAQIPAEIGVDMSRFRSAAHLASWARLCPGMNESGAKRRNASIGGGNLWVRSTLVEVALASVRSGRRQPNFFSARYHRLAARRGGKRAAIAVAHSMLIAIYRMLQDGTHFEDLGPTHLEAKRRQAIALRSVKRLEELGFKVTIEEPAA